MGNARQTIVIPFILLTLVLKELALDGEDFPLCQCKILAKKDLVLSESDLGKILSFFQLRKYKSKFFLKCWKT